MTILTWSLLAATLLVYLSKVPMNYLTLKQEKFDNNQPRLQQLTLTGIGHRAWAAHQNTIEAYPMFVAGILIAHTTGSDLFWSGFFAIGFLITRVLFIILYLADLAFLRSFSCGIGYLAILGLMLSPLIPAS